METNNELVSHLIEEGILESKDIIKSFYHVDRKDFVGFENLENTYLDIPLSIGYGQTISQPTTVAFMLELLGPQSGENILDIGSGSGWTTALLGYIVGEQGSVLGLERIDELVTFGNNNIRKYNFSWANIQKAGKKLGIPGKKFDKILVSASGNTIPNELIEQLTIGGIMVIPIQNSIYKIEKISNDNISIKEFPNFVFVPLIT